MPVTVRETDEKFRVSTPGGVKAKGTTREKAEAQRRLLQAVEHGFRPTGRKGKPFRRVRHNPGHIPGHESFESIHDLRASSPQTMEEFHRQVGD